MSIGSMGGRRGGRARNLDSRAGLAVLFAMLALWLWAVTEGVATHPGRLLDFDYAVYVGAAHILQAGGNLYDHAALLVEEKRLLAAEHLTIGRPALARIGEPPVLFWALEPLAALPFQLSALVFDLFLAVGAAAGGLATYVAVRRESIRWEGVCLTTAVLLAMPPTVIYVLSGNIGVVMFAAVGVGLLLAPRRPLIAGMILSLTIVKPQVALPLAGLILLFQAGSIRRGIAGFSVGVVAIVGASALAAGPRSIGWWVAGIHDFSGTIPVQGAMPSLPGLYGWAPGDLRALLSAGIVMIAVVATIVTFLQLRRWQRPVPLLSVGWLWVLWFLAAPYCHLMDEVFLAPVVLAMLVGDSMPSRADVSGGTRRGGLRGSGIALLYGAILSVLPVPLPSGISILPVVPLVAFAILVVHGHKMGPAVNEQDQLRVPVAIAPASSTHA
ncbi:MAG TPA: glycosyltransferase family 87 protein [Chloroflexota bacterium]|nr:glycosyltransferase family 87 protein [Chloroflexota bacterium]